MSVFLIFGPAGHFSVFPDRYFSTYQGVGRTLVGSREQWARAEGVLGYWDE